MNRTLSLFYGLVDLTSNDYFGFATSLATQISVDRIGATGSRLLTGNSPLCQDLEEKLATFHRAESCLIYNSGYTANLGLLAALGTQEVTFIYDIEVHASMIDGMRLSKATTVPFRHNDLNSLERRLRKSTSSAFVLVESIYSISGDLAPLQEIAALCLQYGAALIVDEAHATGVCGPQGVGRVAELSLESLTFARVHTFSKALGCHGACVLGSLTLKKYLINFSRPFIYTTALPLPLLAWIWAGYEKLQQEAAWHQTRLRTLIAYFQTRLGIQGPLTPIQPIYTAEAQKYSQKLRDLGLDVRAIFPPTTKRACLRVVLHSFNQEEEIDHLVKVLQ